MRNNNPGAGEAPGDRSVGGHSGKHFGDRRRRPRRRPGAYPFRQEMGTSRQKYEAHHPPSQREQLGAGGDRGRPSVRVGCTGRAADIRPRATVGDQHGRNGWKRLSKGATLWVGKHKVRGYWRQFAGKLPLPPAKITNHRTDQLPFSGNGKCFQRFHLYPVVVRPNPSRERIVSCSERRNSGTGYKFFRDGYRMPLSDAG